MHNLDRLPKWARERIESAERQIKRLNQDLSELQGAIPPTPVHQVINHGFCGEPRSVRFLNDDEVIFMLPNPVRKDWPEIEIGVQRRTLGDAVYLSVNSRRSLSVKPCSGNVVHIHAEDY